MNEDNKDRAIEKAVAMLEQKIEEHGYAVQAVFAIEDEPAPPFAYTVGLHKMVGGPGFELVILGLPYPVNGQFINQLIKEKLFELDKPHMLDGNYWPGYPFVLKKCEPRAMEYARAVRRFYGADTPLVQIVLSDVSKNMPWDEEYDSRMNMAQPLLFSLD